jgi:hypothetical protein
MKWQSDPTLSQSIIGGKKDAKIADPQAVEPDLPQMVYARVPAGRQVEKLSEEDWRSPAWTDEYQIFFAVS